MGRLLTQLMATLCSTGGCRCGACILAVSGRGSSRARSICQSHSPEAQEAGCPNHMLSRGLRTSVTAPLSVPRLMLGSCCRWAFWCSCCRPQSTTPALHAGDWQGQYSSTSAKSFASQLGGLLSYADTAHRLQELRFVHAGQSPSRHWMPCCLGVTTTGAHRSRMGSIACEAVQLLVAGFIATAGKDALR